MYVQKFVKGIASDGNGSDLNWEDAKALIADGSGLQSQWLRNRVPIHPERAAKVLTAERLDQHLHEYASYGHDTPFISLTAGSVERDARLKQNAVYSARMIALTFATRNFTCAGALFYGWTFVGLNPAIEIQALSEPVRELHVYTAWSDYQLEGEIAAKIHIPANQIERLEWWDPDAWRGAPNQVWRNVDYRSPAPALNLRGIL